MKSFLLLFLFSFLAAFSAQAQPHKLTVLAYEKKEQKNHLRADVWPDLQVASNAVASCVEQLRNWHQYYVFDNPQQLDIKCAKIKVKVTLQHSLGRSLPGTLPNPLLQISLGYSLLCQERTKAEAQAAERRLNCTQQPTLACLQNPQVQQATELAPPIDIAELDTSVCKDVRKYFIAKQIEEEEDKDRTPSLRASTDLIQSSHLWLDQDISQPRRAQSQCVSFLKQFYQENLLDKKSDLGAKCSRAWLAADALALQSQPNAYSAVLLTTDVQCEQHKTKDLLNAILDKLKQTPKDLQIDKLDTSVCNILTEGNGFKPREPKFDDEPRERRFQSKSPFQSAK